MEMSPMTTDATAASLSKEIAAARERLIELCQDPPEGGWPAHELKNRARNGWSDGALNIALSRLIEDGTLVAEGDRVRLS
jgi:Elongation factor SelB, winged helix